MTFARTPPPPPPPHFSVLSECTKRKNGERKHALSACVYSGNLAGGLELKQSSVYSLICRWEARSRFQTTITQNETWELNITKGPKTHIHWSTFTWVRLLHALWKGSLHASSRAHSWVAPPPPREVRRNDNAVSDWLPRATRGLAARARAEASCLIQPKFKPVDRQV